MAGCSGEPDLIPLQWAGSLTRAPQARYIASLRGGKEYFAPGGMNWLEIIIKLCTHMSTGSVIIWRSGSLRGGCGELISADESKRASTGAAPGKQETFAELKSAYTR
ncbi:hypothetical protein, unlikely [Trypanosoma congolense IL3000]|uniref:Uncharacterized protein n=1 Tax=Trypanosoma congolense (strain IL3000) TaxID=1068625 RepID=F9WC67_TRYCI|nr:hypothetical protein, unlikely [Trypanosoma congolense IL3000]CCD14859.1 hypothetical protein, unlikely [Trypanosoma congolense IL3000]